MPEKHLVIVTTAFPVRRDGSEAAGSFVGDLVEELATLIPVRVVARGEAMKREKVSDRLEIFRYPSPDPTRTLSTLKFWPPSDLRWIARVLRDGLAATRAAVDANSAHVLAMWGLPGGEWARRVARERGIDYSVWLLGSDVWSLGRLPIVRSWLARVIRQATHAYADGYQLAQAGHQIAGVPIGFLPTTRRILSSDPVPPRAGPPYRLLFLGRWHPNKGVDLLLDALAMLQSEDWRSIERIEIQGGGPLDSLVRERVAALHASGRPVFAGGFLAKSEAEVAIVNADWVIIPSRIESIPVVFSDAVKLNRPVVTMPTGDLPRLLGESPRCGISASQISAGALCAALQDALRTSPRDFTLGARSMARRFDLSAIAAQLCGDLA